MATPTIVQTGAPGNPDRLAYFDSIAGLVPCRVLAVVGEGNASTDRVGLGDAQVVIEVTAARGPYQRGEVLSRRPYNVWARSHVRQSRRGPSYAIVTPHNWRDLLDGGRS